MYVVKIYMKGQLNNVAHYEEYDHSRDFNYE